MTITAQTAKTGPYDGNGSTTSFDYLFRVNSASDLVVTVLGTNGFETVKVLTTDYTVTGVGNAGGGSIIMNTAPITGEKLTITRSVALNQEVDLQNRGAVNPETLEESLDKLTQIAQDQQEQLDRSLKVDLFDTADLAQLTNNVNVLAAIAPNITTVAGVSSDVTTVAGISSDVTTVSGISANVTTVAGISSDVTAVAGDEVDIGVVSANITNVNTVAGISGNVTTVAGISADVTAVAGDATDIGTVSANIANVNTVASISTDVTTVSGISADVTAVAADATDIGTVATNIASVNTVAGISSDVTAVAADATDIGTVAADIADVSTVAGISSAVSTVAGISSDVTAVAADATDIGTVATNIADVSTVAGISSAVSTVAGISADVTAVAADATDIGTVAGISADVSTVAGISSNVTTVAGIDADVTAVAGISADVTAVAADATDIGTVAADIAAVSTVAGISSDVTTVAGISSDVTTVAADTADIGTVAGISSDVSTVAGISSDIPTVAANAADITNFADVYLGPKTSDPSVRNDGSALQIGDLYFDTVNDVMNVYEGAGWIAAYASLSGALIASNNLSDLSDASVSRTNLGLGTGDSPSFTAVSLAADPTTNLQAATKQYVDTIAAAGLHYHAPVRVEEPTALTVTYNNGTAGVGATLTNAGAQAALVLDGVTLNVADRVLVYQQADATQNGIYTVTDVGSGSTNWVLTRATDADSYGASDPDGLGQGDAFFVLEGDTGAGELYVMNTEGTITFGTTNITFAQVASTAVYSAGNGLSLTGTVFSVAAGAGLTQEANGLAHADTSGQATVTNTGATFIQSVTLDTYGHVTGLDSTTLTAATVGALAVGAKAADSDLLDGLDSAAFLRSDTSDTFTSLSGQSISVSGELNQGVSATSGTSVSLTPTLGGVVYHTLNANVTFTDGISNNGSSLVVMIVGNGFTVTWPTINWVNNGNVAPALSAAPNATIVALWKANNTLYGAFVGSNP